MKLGRLFFLCMFFAFFLQGKAQSSKTDLKVTRKITPSEDVVNPDNWNRLDPIAKTIYTEEQAIRMPEVKIRQVNYLYTQSYKIKESGCSIDLKKIDFSALFQKRDAKHHVDVPVTQDACKVQVELLSTDEVNKEFVKIQNQL